MSENEEGRVPETYEVMLTVEYRGRTETVRFWGITGAEGQGVHLWNDDTWAAKIGRGQKVYRATVNAWPVATMHPNTRRGYGRRDAPIVTDANGVEWGVNLANTTIRNRQAYLVGWSDQFFGTEVANKYQDYSALAKPKGGEKDG